MRCLIAGHMLARPVGGWPAPFLADDPSTSVTLRLGVEDTFRPGPFVADYAFWLLLLHLAWQILGLVANRKRARTRRRRSVDLICG